MGHPGGELSQLLDVIEEDKHALLEQLRGTFVVVGQAVVGEQVSIAGVQEQLGALDRREVGCVGDRPLVRRNPYLRMLTARDTTSATVNRDAADWTIINNLAQAVSGMVSVGLKAVALVKDVYR